MTTKRKIIIGFTLVLIVLAAVAVVGYRGLTGASADFEEYRRLARINVALSDMLVQAKEQAFQLEQFLSGRDSKFTKAAQEATRRAIEQAKLVRDGVNTAERTAAMEAIIRDLEAYGKTIADVDKNLGSWQTQYDKTILPGMQNVENAIQTISDNAARTENVAVLSRISNVWHEVSNLSSAVSDFDGDISEANAKAVLDTFVRLRKNFEALSAVMTSTAAIRDMADVKKNYDAFENTFIQHHKVALTAMKEVENTVVLDTKIADGAINMNVEMDGVMRAFGTATLASNDNSQYVMMAASVVGMIIGAAFAVFIILSLIKTLNRVSGYATAVAGGDFAYDPKITEKGESRFPLRSWKPSRIVTWLQTKYSPASCVRAST